MDTCCRETTDQHFNDEVARKDLQAYRRGRLNKTIRVLLKALHPRAVQASSLLDIGGGAGVILHELLAGSAMAANVVEIASAYVRVAREEAKKRGYGDRFRFMQGDFVSIAGNISEAELVTLDRVEGTLIMTVDISDGDRGLIPNPEADRIEIELDWEEWSKVRISIARRLIDLYCSLQWAAYFPIQNVENICPSISSVSVSPVTSPSAASPA